MKKYIKYICYFIKYISYFILQKGDFFMLKNYMFKHIFCCDAFFIMEGYVYSIFISWLAVSQPSSQFFSNLIETHK